MPRKDFRVVIEWFLKFILTSEMTKKKDLEFLKATTKMIYLNLLTQALKIAKKS